MGLWLLPPYNPVHVDDVLIVFPGEIEFLMPDPGEILRSESLPLMWVRFQYEWFRYGLQNAQLVPHDDIDAKEALRHLQCIQGSYGIKHEHKQQAVAFLASIWFTNDSSWERAEPVK